MGGGRLWCYGIRIWRPIFGLQEVPAQDHPNVGLLPATKPSVADALPSPTKYLSAFDSYLL